MLHIFTTPARPQHIPCNSNNHMFASYIAFPIGHRSLIRLFVGRYALGQVPSTTPQPMTLVTQTTEDADLPPCSLSTDFVASRRICKFKEKFQCKVQMNFASHLHSREEQHKALNVKAHAATLDWCFRALRKLHRTTKITPMNRLIIVLAWNHATNLSKKTPQLLRRL